MTPLMPEVQQALMGAARRRARPARRRRLSRRTGLLSLAAVLAGGSALAATAWHPQLGDDAVGHPTVAAGDLPPDQLAALGVLRREQTDRDRGPLVQAMLKLNGPHDSGGIHVDGVRLLAARGGGGLVLIPMQRAGSHDRGYPSSIQRDVLCVLESTHSGSAGGSCGTTADLHAGRIDGFVPVGSGRIKVDGRSNPGTGRMRFFTLVPDGVARIELKLRDGVLLAADVHDNAAEFVIDGGMDAFPGGTPRWLDASGAEVSKKPAP